MFRLVLRELAHEGRTKTHLGIRMAAESERITVRERQHRQSEADEQHENGAGLGPGTDESLVAIGHKDQHGDGHDGDVVHHVPAVRCRPVRVRVRPTQHLQHPTKAVSIIAVLINWDPCSNLPEQQMKLKRIQIPNQSD